MSYEDHVYHRERERHCRSMAELAANPDIRRRHEQLAALHAMRAGTAESIFAAASELSAA